MSSTIPKENIKEIIKILDQILTQIYSIFISFFQRILFTQDLWTFTPTWSDVENTIKQRIYFWKPCFQKLVCKSPTLGDNWICCFSSSHSSSLITPTSVFNRISSGDPVYWMFPSSKRMTVSACSRYFLWWVHSNL